VKSRQVIFTPEARHDLFGIYEWISSKASLQVAISYIERLETYCLGFNIASERGHRRDDVSPGLRIVGFERRGHHCICCRRKSGNDSALVLWRAKLGGQASMNRTIQSLSSTLDRCKESNSNQEVCK
jgi:toxin ParE1/3/4